MTVESAGGLGPPPFERSPDQDFFQSLERGFIALRGAPLQLSPADFAVAKEWRADGVPLDLVLEIVAEVVERRREAEKEVPKRLGYYRRAVARAWQDRQRLQAPGAPADAERLDAGRRLRALADALAGLGLDQPGEAGTAEGPAGAATQSVGAGWAVPLVRTLGELAEAATTSSAAEIEDRLIELDRQMLASAHGALPPSARRDLEARVDGALDRLRGRLPTDELERSRNQLRDQMTRRELALPTLSLFGPEAAAADGADAGAEAGPAAVDGPAAGS